MFQKSYGLLPELLAFVDQTSVGGKYPEERIGTSRGRRHPPLDSRIDAIP